jgi:hypothetical protein
MLGQVLNELTESRKELSDSRKESLQIQKDMFEEQLKMQARHSKEMTRLTLNNVHILANLERLQRAHDVRGALGMYSLEVVFCILGM